MAVDPRSRRRQTPARPAPTVDAFGQTLSPAPMGFQDFSPNEQAGTHQAMRVMSDTMNDRLRYQKDLDEQRQPLPSGKFRDPKAKVLKGVTDEQIAADPVPGGMTMRRATAAREHWVAQAEDEARYRNDLEALAGTGRVHAPRGTTWYSEHNAQYRQLAGETGLPVSDLIHAGTVLSPNSSPTTELRSARGVAGMADPSLQVSVSPEQASAARHIQTKPDSRGKASRTEPVPLPAGEYPVGDLATPQAALLSSTVNMAHPEGVWEEGMPPPEPGKGTRFAGMPDAVGLAASARNRGHVVKALGMLRGEITTAEANGVMTSPKMLGYSRSTQLGTPMEAERTYSQAMRRVSPLEQAGQQQLDLGWNVVDDSTTAEDSWMHGMSYHPDDLGVVKPLGSQTGLAGGGTQPARPYGATEVEVTSKSGKVTTKNVADPRRVASKDLVAASHAWNNEATNRAADRLGYTPQATQAISWTAQRIAAGDDPEYKREQAAWDAAVAAGNTGSRQLEGQGEMFPGVGS